MSSDVDSNSSTLDGAATPLSPEVITAARRTVAANAAGVEDCTELLEMLGLSKGVS